MADTAFMTMYRNEFIAGFEQTQSLIRDTVTTETQIKGNQAVFLVADSNGATTVTRGVNGLIPARADNLNQYTATLTEEHDLVRKTGFNIFASQGDQRKIMQMTSMGVVNRKMDSQIITELNTATNDTGTTATASLNMVAKSVTILGNNEVPVTQGKVTGLITPAYLGYLMQTKEFANAEYVTKKPFENAPVFDNAPGYYKWFNINWIVHPNLPGVGTSAEKCFLYHRDAIGHAVNTGGIDSKIGYDDEQDYSYARTSIYMGAKLLQNSGVVVMNHDGSAYASS
jgi:hypothetical protein